MIFLDDPLPFFFFEEESSIGSKTLFMERCLLVRRGLGLVGIFPDCSGRVTFLAFVGDGGWI